MTTNEIILTLFIGLGVFGTPTFIFWIWALYLEIRDYQDTIRTLQERLHLRPGSIYEEV